MIGLALQVAQAHAQAKLTDPVYAEALGKGFAFTAREGDRTVAVAGVMERWEGCGQAWALMSRNIGRGFVTVHRAVSRFLDVTHFRRVEMAVDAKHAAAARWAVMLGFQREGLMRAYTPDGRDCYLYAKVK